MSNVYSRFADSDIAMRYTHLGIGHGHERISKPQGNLQWGTPWADWEEQDDEGMEDLALYMGGSDEESECNEDDVDN
jgi:hypothetical protein